MPAKVSGYFLSRKKTLKIESNRDLVSADKYILLNTRG